MSVRKSDLTRLGENLVDVENQKKQLLWKLKKDIILGIPRLKRKGFIGEDGNLCAPLSPPARIFELRSEGWVIETRHGVDSAYIYRGHIDEFDEEAKILFIKKGWVYPSRRKIIRLKE